jgi:YaiO family outer membrane protein
MRYSIRIAVFTAVLAGAAGMAATGAGLSVERSGLGLKPPGTTLPWAGGLARRSELAGGLQAAESGNVAYAGGVREVVRLGLRTTTESYIGIYAPLSDAWGTSLEVGLIQGSAWAPRRYSVAGQLHTALTAESGLSLGLKYRVYDADLGARFGVPGDIAAANGYSLVPVRVPGAAFGPSYQLQLSYQYNTANMFGVALGRELETFTPGFDLAGTSLRQLTFTGQHWLTPSWALSYDVLSHDPGNPFRLQGLRFGIRYRF